MIEDFDKKGYDVKNMRGYIKYGEVKYSFYSNGYHEANNRIIVHTLKETDKISSSTMSFPFESVSLIHFEAGIKGKDCEPVFSHAKGTVKYQYITNLTLQCKEKIPKGSDIEIYVRFKLMDWVLNNKQKILDVLNEIYGDKCIAFLLPVTTTTPIIEYHIDVSYPGFKIRKSKKVVADKADVFGKPLSVIYEEDIPHKESEVSVNWDNLTPNKTYILLNYLE